MKNMVLSYFIIGLLMLLLCSIAIFVLYPHSYRKHFNERYLFKHQFPFEMLYRDAIYLPLGRFMVILASIVSFLSSGFFLSTISLYPDFLSMAVMVVLIYALSSACFALLFLVRADIHLKLHLFILVGLGLFSALSDAMCIIAYLHFSPGNNALSLLGAIVLGLLGIGKVVLLLNPKLSSWSKLDSSVDESGVITHTRPKIFWIALTEWGLLLLHVLSSMASLSFFFRLIFPLL